MLVVANLGPYKMMQKAWRMTEILAHGYSTKSTHREPIPCIATRQGLGGSRKSLHLCALTLAIEGLKFVLVIPLFSSLFSRIILVREDREIRDILLRR